MSEIARARQGGLWGDVVTFGADEPAQVGQKTTAMALRPYQDEAIAAIEGAWADGVRRQLLVLPTGGGKTVVFASLIGRRGGRALVLAHRDELIEQAADKLRTVVPGVRVGIVKADRDEFWAPVVVASVQTVARPNRLSRMTGSWTTVVVDEAHHSAAKSYADVLTGLGCFGDGPLLLGVTATADRHDKRSLGQVFDRVVYEVGMLDLILQGYLCDLRAVKVEVETNLDDVGVTGGDFNLAQLERRLEADDYPYWAAEAIAAHARDRRTLVFLPTVALADETAGELTNRGMKAAAVNGEMPIDERRSLLARFACGDLQALANCNVLTEGYDAPFVDCVAVARPTKSRSLYQQMVGRGTRIHPGKADCLIVDVCGVSAKHSLQSAATLAGIDGWATGATAGATLTEAFVQLGGLVREPATGKMIVLPIELFSRRDVAWVPRSDGAWVLSAGAAGTVMLAPRNGRWAVVHAGPDGVAELARDLDLGYAQGIAEGAVRRMGGAALIDRRAPWRTEAATPKQIARARFEGVRIAGLPVTAEGVLTKGVVSDAITAAVARKQGRVA